MNERARTLFTLMLAALIIYVSTDDVVVGLAVGLLVGLVTMFGLGLLVPDLLVWRTNLVRA